MSRLILFNKPYLVLSQFTDKEGRQTLADFISQTEIYPAGRLDYDSEGLLLLTDDGRLQHRIASPDMKLAKTYQVQVEGEITDEALRQLRQGVTLKDGLTRPAKARKIAEPDFPPRVPPVRERKNIPTSWIELTISEGRNRQVRRMTAATGFPTLRLIRVSIGDWSLDELSPGEYKELQINLPATDVKANRRPNIRKKPAGSYKAGKPRTQNRKSGAGRSASGNRPKSR